MSLKFDVLSFLQAGVLSMWDPAEVRATEPLLPVDWPPVPRSAALVEQMRVEFAVLFFEVVAEGLRARGVVDVAELEPHLQAWAVQQAERAMKAGRDAAGWGDPAGLTRLKYEFRRSLLRSSLEAGVRDHRELARRLGVSRATYYRQWRPLVPLPDR